MTSCQLLTVIMNGTVLIISNMKDIWKICSQMFPWKGNQMSCNQMKEGGEDCGVDGRSRGDDDAQRGELTLTRLL